MIAIQELRELVRTIIYTGYLLEEKPVSAILIANKGSGKSEVLNEFRGIDNLGFYTDITYIGLLDSLQTNKYMNHIIIPDFLKATMKKKSTSDNFISGLNALIEEGLDKVSFPNKNYEFNNRKCGLITATTSDSFFQHQKEWDSMGFISRMLTISYCYSDKTKEQIFDYIFNRRYMNNIFNKERLPKKKLKIELKENMAKQLYEKSNDFRKQKILQSLSMARAIINNRKVVTQQEIDEVNSMKKFINLLFVEI